MANSINGNINIAHQLSNTRGGTNTQMTRLGSGSRINSAKDDPAGLAISDRFNSQIRGLNQAIRNGNDGISMAQTADGALAESADILQRMRELAVQSSNGTYSDTDRASMNEEFSQLQSEIDRIAGETSFNGQNILDGSLESGGASFQVGANADQTIEVTIGGATQADLGTDSLSLLTSADSADAIGAIDNALGAISAIRADLGAAQTRFDSAISNIGNVAENLEASDSRISDADMAKEVSEMVKNRILEQSGVAMQSQANQQSGALLALLK